MLQTRSKHLAELVAGKTPLYTRTDPAKPGQRRQCEMVKNVYVVRHLGNVEVDLDGRAFEHVEGRNGTEAYWHHNIGRREGGAGGIDIHLVGGLTTAHLRGQVVVRAELRVREWFYADGNGWQNFAYILELAPPESGAPTFRLMVGPVESRDTSFADGYDYVENGARLRAEPIEGVKPSEKPEVRHPAFTVPTAPSVATSAGSPGLGTFQNLFQKGGLPKPGRR